MRLSPKVWALLVLAGILMGLLWVFPTYLPFVSPIDQALWKANKAPDAKERLDALLSLQKIIREHPLPPFQRDRLVRRLFSVAEKDPDERIRSFALTLLRSLGELGAEMQRLLLLALRRSASEVRLAEELLPQIASAPTWQRLMETFAEETDPLVRYRLARILSKTPMNVWRPLCEFVGRAPQRWREVVDKLAAPPVGFRAELVSWALSGSEPLQLGALELLTKFPPSPADAERLAPLLRSQNLRVREKVLAIVAKSPSAKFIPDFRKFLQSEPHLALLASMALLKLGALSPVEGRQLLRHSYAPLRAQGALALAPSRKPEDLQALKTALSDPDPEVVRNATIALVAKGTEGLSIVLRRYTKEANWERRAAMLMGMAGMAHPKVISALVHALRFGDWRERGAALAGLSFHKDNALPAIQQLLPSPHRSDRLAAIEALKAIQTPKALQLLLQVGRQDPDPQIRCEALLVLSDLGVQEALPLLAELVRKGEASIASTAAVGLTRYGEEGRKKLRELLHSERPETRLAAARALALLNDRAALSFLRGQASNEDLAQRMTFLQLMARAGDEKALRELVGLLACEEPLVRLRARLGLYSVGKPAIPLLLQALDSADERVRAEAALVLGALRAEIAREKLASLLKDSSPQVRDAAKQALARLEQVK